jgi:short-subunit dehydrogenase
MKDTQMQLRDAVIIVTGASAGIGLATTKALAESGAHVVAVARRADTLNTIIAALPGQHIWFAGDLSNPDTMKQVVAHAITEFGHIDAIVCNAGVGLSAPVAHLQWHDMIACMNLNVGGVLSAIQAVMPHFMTQQRGSIVVISSVVGVQGLPYSGGYCASKGALERLCDALRIELIGTPIRLSVVRPGTVATQFFAQRLGSNGERRSRTNRGVSPETVAHVICSTLIHHPRFSYTRWQDRVLLWASALAPRMADHVLRRMIQWQS